MVLITIDISDELWRESRGSGIKYRAIFIRGWNCIHKHANVNEEIDKLNQSVDRLQNKLSAAYGRLAILEDKNGEL
jgi:hypothetical protein